MFVQLESVTQIKQKGTPLKVVRVMRKKKKIVENCNRLVLENFIKIRSTDSMYFRRKSILYASKSTNFENDLERAIVVVVTNIQSFVFYK